VSSRGGPLCQEEGVFSLSIESVIMTVRYLSGLPTHIRSGRALMHNNVLHGPNWTSGLNGFRYWTESQPPDGLFCAPVAGLGESTMPIVTTSTATVPILPATAGALSNWSGTFRLS
jgi:hypothetical protein